MSLITLWAIKHIAGSYKPEDSRRLGKILQAAAERCHLLGGQTQATIPPGWVCNVSVVPIPRYKTYHVRSEEPPPRRGLGAGLLFDLAAAVGATWPQITRLDDGSDPRFAHYRATMAWRQPDGTLREITEERVQDNRDGSDELVRRTEPAVVEMRRHTDRSARTKAKCRCIRQGFGIPHAMPEPELLKPFVVVRLQFTGDAGADRPELQHGYNQVLMMQALAGLQQAFPTLNVNAVLAAMPEQVQAGVLPPAPGAAPRLEQSSVVDPSVPDPPQMDPRRRPDVILFPPRVAGTPLADCNLDQLVWYRDELRKVIPMCPAKDLDLYEASLTAVGIEIQEREVPPPPEEAPVAEPSETAGEAAAPPGEPVDPDYPDADQAPTEAPETEMPK